MSKILSFEGMNLTENILISNIFIVSSLQLFIINMTVCAGLPTKDETTMTTWSS